MAVHRQIQGAGANTGAGSADDVVDGDYKEV